MSKDNNMKQYCLLVAAACVASGSVAEAANCRSRIARARATRVVVESEVQFAIPVATVVVAVQPALYYSYRAAAHATSGGAPRMDATATVESVPRTAETVLRERCIACHRGDAPKGGLAFFENDGALLKALPRRAMLEMASPDNQGVVQMPPGEATKLSAEDLEILRQWAEPPRDLRY